MKVAAEKCHQGETSDVFPEFEGILVRQGKVEVGREERREGAVSGKGNGSWRGWKCGCYSTQEQEIRVWKQKKAIMFNVLLLLRERGGGGRRD